MTAPTIDRPRHRHPAAGHPLRKAVATSVVASALIGAGWSAAPAFAAPGESQPGVTDGPDTGQPGVTDNSPDQGGVTDTPPQPSTPNRQQDNYVGPGAIPGPPTSTVPPSVPTAPPSYSGPYTPSIPTSPPKKTEPVTPIAPPPNKIRVGNFVTDIPQGMPMTQVRSINQWSSWGEAQIARELIARGVPRDKATRQAAATIIGVAVGGATGGVLAASVTAVVSAPIVIPVATALGIAIGAGVGATMPPYGALAGPGALVGAGVGFASGVAATAALSLAAGAAGATAGAILGGLLANWLGAGDPGSSAPRPLLPGEKGPGAPQYSQPWGPNSYRVTMGPEHARKAGLPPVDYQVNLRGDVRISANVGGTTYHAGWTGEQARAPYKALGPHAGQARKAVDNLTRQGTAALQKALPGAKVTWGAPPATAKSKARHRR